MNSKFATKLEKYHKHGMTRIERFVYSIPQFRYS